MAARNIVLKFGELVSIPLKKENAIQATTEVKNLCVGQPGKPEHAPSLRKAPLTCEHCDLITDTSLNVKGVAMPDGTFALVDTDDVTEAKASFSDGYKGVIDLVAHPAGAFLAATGPGDSIAYLYPPSDAVAGQYATIVAFIEAHPELAFVGLNTPGTVTALFQVSVRGGILVMEKRTRSQSLVPARPIEAEPMAKLLMFLDMTLEDSLTEYDPDAYEDKYQTALAELAEASTDIVSIDEGSASSTPVQKGLSDADMVAKLAALSTTVPAKKKKAKKEVAA